MVAPAAAFAGLALALAVAGCGGGDPLPAAGPGAGDPGSGPNASPSPGTTPTPDPSRTPVPTPEPTPTPVPTPESTPRPEPPFGGLPVFPGSRPVAIDMQGDDWSATYRTGASLVSITAFYDDALPEAGWQIQRRTVRRDEVEYEAARGDLEGKVRVRRRGPETEIRLTIERD